MAPQTFRPDPSDPVARYGRKPGARRSTARTWVLSGLGVLLLVAITFWVWSSTVRPGSDVAGRLVSFDDVTDSSVDVRFRVDRPDDVAVSCVLAARSLDGAEVGRARVDVPPGDGSVELRHVVQTTMRAVSADVVSCTETASD